MTLSAINKNSVCQQYLNLLYSTYQGDSLHNRNISETYGEILYPSINKLLSIVSLRRQDVFLDLGSGIGKIVLQVFLQTEVNEAIGIEIQNVQHEQAMRAAKKIESDFPEFYEKNRKLTFIHGDFLKLPWNHVTTVFINSTCFSQTILHSIGKRLNNTPSIHTVMTSRPINSLERLPFKKIVRVECSWDSALCYIYQG